MAKRREFKISSWRDKHKYICKYCGYSCLSLDRIKEHIESNHREIPEKKPLQIPIYDRYGNLIKYKEE